MPPAFRYQNATRLLAGLTVSASAFLGVHFYRVWLHSPPVRMEHRFSGGFAFSDVSPASADGDWRVFQSRTGPAKSLGVSGDAIAHYRLAGTFFIEGGGESQRRAILDSIGKREQNIVSEGERIDDLTVEKIYFDHVILRGASGTLDIWVDFAAKAQSSDGIGTNAVPVENSPSTNKYGCVRTEEGRWKFSRKPLLDYYQELLDEPDRMVKVFDTMKPVRDERNKITGYVVGIEGEKDFFEAVGLRQGDIVRAVNSLPMTNRRRAEMFIDQFLKDRLNAVVLEVERSGQVSKQIYQLQP